MSEWCLQHPWMTFFIALFSITTMGSTMITIFGRREETQKKRPDVDGDRPSHKPPGNPDLN